MMTAVDFDDNHGVEASEVRNVRPNRGWAPEPAPTHLTVAKASPAFALGISQVLSELARS